MHSEAFYCPFCGEQDLWPHGAQHGSWECRGCLRAFQLTTLGLIERPSTAPTTRPEVRA